MRQYLDLAQKILDKGIYTKNRTGVDTISLFGESLKFDLNEGFPLLTTKKLVYKHIFNELIWFLQGKTNINDLPEESRFLWAPWADSTGDCGNIYGKQWRKWEGINQKSYKFVHNESSTLGWTKEVDQITWLLNEVKTNPDSRRLILNTWQPAELDSMSLAPCHCLYQLRVFNGVLHSQMYQRSADYPIGVPYNIASYALLTHLIANECNLIPGTFTHVFGDVHIYNNQLEGIYKQLKRPQGVLPRVSLPKGKPVLDIKIDDIVIQDYNPQPFIKFPVAV